MWHGFTRPIGAQLARVNQYLAIIWVWLIVVIRAIQEGTSYKADELNTTLLSHVQVVLCLFVCIKIVCKWSTFH